MADIDNSNQRELAELVQQLGDSLTDQNRFLCTAESCTGGGIAALMTSIAGSSGWFDRAYVTYSNEAKVAMLGVSESSLDKFGAVSEQVAREMAEGALAVSELDVAVSVTGIAGPGGGSIEKPVGTVCFGWSDGAITRTVTQHFKGDREMVRQASVKCAVSGLLSLISG